MRSALCGRCHGWHAVRVAGPADRCLRFDQVGLVADSGAVILRAVDLSLPLAGVTAIVGPSGSGKSSLLRLCNRLDAPTSGRVLLDGVDLAALDVLALRRRVGMVFQRPALFAGTVRDNCRVARPDGDDVTFAGVLSRCGLEASFLDRSADELSGGEAQRACLARTLLTGPEVVLADEVTAALDADNRDRIEALARSLADSGLAVLWVTHDLAQARRLADRTVVVLDHTVATPDQSAAFIQGSR